MDQKSPSKYSINQTKFTQTVNTFVGDLLYRLGILSPLYFILFFVAHENFYIIPTLFIAVIWSIYSTQLYTK